MIEALAATKLCEDEPQECYQDSGPYCGEHDRALMDVMVKAAKGCYLSAGRGQAMTPEEQARIELSQQLIRRACETGCIGLRAQVDETTCLIVYPDHKLEWCVACLMTRAAEMLTEKPNTSPAEGVAPLEDKDDEADSSVRHARDAQVDVAYRCEANLNALHNQHESGDGDVDTAVAPACQQEKP